MFIWVRETAALWERAQKQGVTLKTLVALRS
jgi:hypothetical protein